MIPRYTRPEMARVWSDQNRYEKWLEVELAATLKRSGRTLTEANVVRSFRAVGQWSGAAVRLTERFPQGQDIAVVLEAPDGRIIGAGRLAAGGST